MLIKLVTMPFALTSVPSLALTQLQAVVKRRFGTSVSLQTVYANMDFAQRFDDLSQYFLAHTALGFMTGLGDWFFRAAAFPGQPDNADLYLHRFFHDTTTETQQIRRFLSLQRGNVAGFLDRLIDQHGLLEADMVGCTCLFAQTTASIALLHRLKERKPSIVTVLGGASCEGLAGQQLARYVPCVDFVFSGPSLVSFPRLVQSFLDDRPSDRETINGVFSRDNAAAWRIPGEQEGTVALLGDDSDINDPLPLDYEDFLERFDRFREDRDMQPALFFETSRGCRRAKKHACSFCGLNGLNLEYRCMDPAVARAHIEQVLRYYPRVKGFIAADNLMPRSYVDTLFPSFDVPDDVIIKYEIRPDLDAAALRTLCRSGVRLVQPGIESLSTDSLKRMRKGLTAFSNLMFLKDCARLPIELEWNVLVFSPGEPERTYERMMAWIPMLTHLPPPTAVYPIMYTRNSRYLRDPVAFGLSLRPQDFYALTFPFPSSAIDHLAFHFVDDGADQDTIDRWLDRLNERVRYWRQRWFHEDGAEEARLCFLEEPHASTVYDSRSGTPREYVLDAVEVALLKALVRPMSLEALAAACPDISTSDGEQVLPSLLERGLVFEEDGCYLSLVV